MVCKDKDYIQLSYICYKKLENMEYRKLSELKKLDNNPRTIKEEDLARLIQSIRDNPEYFEARPLILSDRTGELVILGGNQRFEASKFLKLDKVPTHLIKGLTEDKEREIIIRDNVSNGQWDYDLLANEWDVSDLDSWGVSLWNNEPEPQQEKDPFDDNGVEGSNKYGVIVMCESESSQESVFTRLTNEGFNCKVVVV